MAVKNIVFNLDLKANNAINALNDLTSKFEKVRDAANDVGKALSGIDVDIKNNVSQISAMKDLIKKLTKEQEKLIKMKALAFDTLALDKYNKKLEELNKQIRDATRTIEKLTKTNTTSGLPKGGSNQAGTVIFTPRVETKEIEKDLKLVEKALFSFKNQVKFAITNMFVFDIAGQVKRLVKDVMVGMAVGQEQLRLSFEVMIGDALKAQQLIDKLHQFAAKTPFTLPGVEKTAKTLLAFGVTLEELFPMMTILGNIASATGSSIDHLAAILGKVKAANKITGEELRQFVENGVPIYKAIEDATGIATASIGAFAEKGVISYDMVKSALKSLSEEGGIYYNLMARQAETIGGKFSTLKDNFFLVLKDIGTAMLPLLSTAIDLGNQLLPIFKNVTEVMKEVVLFFGAIKTPGIILGSVFLVFNIVIKKTTIELGLLSKVLTFLSAPFKNLYESVNRMVDLTFKMTSGIRNLSDAAKAAGVGLITFTGIIGTVASVGLILLEVFQRLYSDSYKLEDAISSVSEEFAKQSVEANNLFNTLAYGNRTYNEKIELINKINSEYKNYIDFQLTEFSNLQMIRAAQDAVNDSLWNNIVLKVKQSQIEHRVREQVEYLMEIEKNFAKQLRESDPEIRAELAKEQNIFRQRLLNIQQLGNRLADAKQEIVRLEENLPEEIERKTKAILAIESYNLNDAISQINQEINKKKEQISKLEEQLRSIYPSASHDALTYSRMSLITSEIEKENEHQKKLLSTKELLEAKNREKDIQGDLRRKSEIAKLQEDLTTLENLRDSYRLSLAKQTAETIRAELNAELEAIQSNTGLWARFKDYFSDMEGVSGMAIEGNRFVESVLSMVEANTALESLFKGFEPMFNKVKKEIKGIPPISGKVIKSIDEFRLSLEANVKPINDVSRALADNSQELKIFMDSYNRYTVDEVVKFNKLNYDLSKSNFDDLKKVTDARIALQKDFQKESLKIMNEYNDAVKDLEEASRAGEAQRIEAYQKYGLLADKAHRDKKLQELQEMYITESKVIDDAEKNLREEIILNNHMKRLDLIKKLNIEIENKTLEADNRLAEARYQNEQFLLTNLEDSFNNRQLAIEKTKEFFLNKENNAIAETQKYLAELNKEQEKAQKERNKIILETALKGATTESALKILEYDRYLHMLRARKHLEEKELEQSEIRKLAIINEYAKKRLDLEMANIKELAELNLKDAKQGIQLQNYKETKMFEIGRAFRTMFQRFEKTTKGQELEAEKRSLKFQIEELQKLQKSKTSIIETYTSLQYILHKKMQDAKTSDERKSFKAEIDRIIELKNAEINAANTLTKELATRQKERLLKENEYEAERNLARRANFVQSVEIFEKVAELGIDTYNKILESQLASTEKLISIQEEKVNKARERALRSKAKGDAEQLQLEEQRLEQLNRQKKQYLEQQKALALTELIINTAVTVAKAAAEGSGVASAVTIGIALASLAVGLISARELATSAAAGFMEGGFTGDKPIKNRFGNALLFKNVSHPEKVAGVVHTNEFVFSPEKTSKYRNILEDVHNNKIDLNVAVDKAKKFDKLSKNSILTLSNTRLSDSISLMQLHVNKKISNEELNNNSIFFELKNEIRDLKEVVKSQDRMHVSIDEKGISAIVSNYIYNKERIKHKK